MKAKKLAAAAARITRSAKGTLDVAIVLGSGLADASVARIVGTAIPYERLHAPEIGVAGHDAVAHVGTWSGKRVVAFAGRAHLYAGFSAERATYLVRLAHASGAKAIVLTNAAGGLNPGYAAGDVMLIADHINLTGASPIDGNAANPFLDMSDAYASRLRELARTRCGDIALREGIYAGVRGPQYETPAEVEALRRLGADAVGMSTVLETIAARAAGLEVLGLSLITNGTGSGKLSHADVLAAAHDGGETVADVIEGLLAAL